MLKTVHLLTGAGAVLLAALPGVMPGALPYLSQTDAFHLAFIGLSNLLFAPLIPQWKHNPRQTLQGFVSALLVLAAVLQALVLYAPLPLVAGEPAVWLGLLSMLAAVVLQLAASRPKKYVSAAPVTFTGGNRDTGTVKWFNTSKGFGFISRDSGDDIFVHFRAIRGEGHRVLVEGQRVEFSVMNRDKGLQAEDVVAAAPGR